MTSKPIGYGAIPDPFDPPEAIMPSGQLGAKVFFAPVGAEPTRPSAISFDGWHQIGWTEPGMIGPPRVSDTPTNGGTTNE